MKFSKRLFDITLIVLASPLLVLSFGLIAIAIKMADGGSIFFVQERIGYNGTTFRMFKFRTMVENACNCGPLITVDGDSRITRAGLWLRKTKLDELPQAINVLRGEMSLVGPRPEVSYYVNKYTEEQRKILNLMPGITDPASIRFIDESILLAREANPEAAYVERIMDTKIRINLEYASHATVLTDFGVIVDTLLKLKW